MKNWTWIQWSLAAVAAFAGTRYYRGEPIIPENLLPENLLPEGNPNYGGGGCGCGG